MSINNFIQKLESYKYNAVNGNWTTALIIDDDIFGRSHHDLIIDHAVHNVQHNFHIATRQNAFKVVTTQLHSDRVDHQLIIKELQKLHQHHFPWVYIRHDHLAYPLVKNILWNVLNQIELKIKAKRK